MKNYIKTNSYTPQEALSKMMRFCSYQDRCVFEVEQKLKEYEVATKDIDFIIDQLIEERFLDEDRFVRVYVLGKFRLKGWGKIKIKAALRQKNISAFKIDEALKLIPDSEYIEKIQKFIEKKKNQLENEEGLKLKEKIFRYLASKGFESNLIFQYL